MKLLGVLLTEISEKLKKQFLKKFSGQTEDGETIILSYIDEFDDYKNGLPSDKRDLNKYSYNDLKGLILTKRKEKEKKESPKTFEDIFNLFRKKGERMKAAGGTNIPHAQLKKMIKKYLEIKSVLPPDVPEISKLEWLDLVELINTSYERLLTKKLKEKYKKLRPDLSETQILYYISQYLDNFDRIPIESKNADEMTFDEMEHLLDGLQSEGPIVQSETDTSGIPLIYDENNLKIYAPTTKDQCIKLGYGRSWCTSAEGSSNLYYNYRLHNGRTLYYVIDNDLPFQDVNFATVVLVDKYGDTALADGTNSGEYSGHRNLPWSQIENKLPKLKGLKDIFVSKPLTEEELNLINEVSRANPDKPTEFFKDEKTMEMWLEMKSDTLTDEQYIDIPTYLKTKYVALGFELSPAQLDNTPASIFKYYVKRRIDKLKTRPLNRLSGGEIALLNSPLPELKRLKEELKPRYAAELGNSTSSGKSVELIFPGRDSVANFMSLYGFENIIPSLPKDLTKLTIKSKEPGLYIKIPDTIVDFKNLITVVFEGCLQELPEAICSLQNLRFLNIPKNPQLKTIPQCVINMPSLNLLNFQGSSNLILPKGIELVAQPLKFVDEEDKNEDRYEMWDFT